MGRDERRFFFLSITWGLIADADLGTENMRWLGSARNLVGALRGIVRQKYLHGKLKYLQVGNSDKSAAQESSQRAQESSYRHVHSNSDNIQSEKSFPICRHLVEHFAQEFEQIAPSFYAEQREHLQSISTTSPIEQDLSKEVQVNFMEDEIFAFVASNVTHIAHDCKIAPNAQLSDGSIDLIILRDKSLSRLGMTKLFMGVEDGSFFQHNSVEYAKVCAFVLTPVDEGSFIAIDGEHGHYDSIIVELHKGLVNLLTM